MKQVRVNQSRLLNQRGVALTFFQNRYLCEKILFSIDWIENRSNINSFSK